jgi:diguanylate cyclase (GGDEF)-like protein
VNWRPGTPFRSGLRAFAWGATASAVIVAISLCVLEPLTLGQHRAQQISREDLALQEQNARLRVTMASFQLFIEPELDAVQGVTAAPLPTEIAKGTQLIVTQRAQATTVSTALRQQHLAGDAKALDAAMSAFTVSITKLIPVASGTHVSPKTFDTLVGGERVAYANVWDLTSSIDQTLVHTVTSSDVAYVTDKFDVARTIMIVFGGITFLLTLAAASVLARRVARRERTNRLDARRHLYGAELQQGLELSNTEGAVYSTVGRALRGVVADLDVELLIADSSRAHFRRVVSSNTSPDHGDGCGVVSPADCPATIRGHTMLFPSSDALSACPYLEGRPCGSLSAVCIPVSIAGRTVGVMHATGPDGVLPDSGDLENLELSARRAAERVALLRTFERSETQARTDPLTGLLNRRSLENQVRELQADGIPYALAYGDLDHFKELNDTHGHEAGDQALRLFSRVMRDAVRPADLVSRYGGEEFVIVLPDCSADTATAVLERVREQLAITLTSGRVPAFTVTFGLATSSDAATFDEIVAAADQALLSAKAAGRNRVLLAARAAEPSAAMPSA